ncbi:MAG: hypothetical protein NXI12_15480, partial [Alphaproteobacteria bacterium]|nr:hypothetical protein [Alphaproteobacteria bacterium]
AAKGREAARFLNQLAKLDLGIFEAAADEVQWLAAQARRKVRTAAPERDRKRPPPADGHPRN